MLRTTSYAPSWPTATWSLRTTSVALMSRYVATQLRSYRYYVSYRTLRYYYYVVTCLRHYTPCIIERLRGASSSSPQRRSLLTKGEEERSSATNVATLRGA